MSSKTPPSDSDLKAYTDAQLSVQVPAYLRQRKAMLLFAAPTRRRDNRCLDMVSALVIDRSDALEAILANMTTMPASMQYMNVQKTILRRGRVDWLQNGFEFLLLQTTHGVTPDLLFDYTVVFGKEGLPVEARFLGHGDQHHFEDVCRAIILSIQYS